VYKGVELFGEFADYATTSKFPQWQIKVRIALKANFPPSVKFISRSAQALQEELNHAVMSASSTEEALQMRRDHEDAERDAAGHLLLFIAEPLSSQVHGLLRGSAVWAYLAEQHDVWLHSRKSCWSTRGRCSVHEGESVAAYCRRAVQLQSDLANANREVSQISMVEAVMDGIERGRPEWTGVLQGMQGSLSGRESVLDIQPDLVRLEVRLNARSGHRAAAASADTATAVGAQSASILALVAKIEELSERLRAIRGQAGAASQSGWTQGGARPQRRERRCYRCGGVDHLVSACPPPGQRGPFAGQDTLRCTPAAVCGSRWMVVSGC
jgi:hypothetical protein